MRIATLFILSSLLFVECSLIQNGETNQLVQFDTLRDPKNQSDFYIQLKESRFDSINDAIDTLRNVWFSRHLIAMKEPIIHEYRGEMEIYRFTLLRTFDQPVVVKLEKKEDSVRLISKMTSGAGGYYCGQLILDTLYSISLEKYDSLIYEIDHANFWKLPTTEHKHTGVDGSEWIVEAYQDGRYHLV